MASTCVRRTLMVTVLLLVCMAGSAAGHLRSLRTGGLGMGLGKGLSLGTLLSQLHQEQTSLDAASRISSSVISAAKAGKGSIWSLPERRLLLASDAAAGRRHLESGGYGGLGSGLRLGFSATQPARQKVALDAMASIEAVVNGDKNAQLPHPEPRPTSMVQISAEEGAGPDRRLQQGGKLEFSSKSINQVRQGQVAATLIRRAAEGRMEVQSAITYTRPTRDRDSLELLAEADGDTSSQLFGRRHLLGGSR